MGFVIQYQRRAIESVMHQEGLRLDRNQKYHLEGSEIYFYGISTGIGTCSDERYHGIDIAVLGKEPAEDRERGLPRSCHGAVLLRTPHEGEIDIAKFPYKNTTVLAIEGLKVFQRDANSITFSSNGKVELYTDLV